MSDRALGRWIVTADLPVTSALVRRCRADRGRERACFWYGLVNFFESRAALSEANLSAVVQWFLVSSAIALHKHGYIDLRTKQTWMDGTLDAPAGDLFQLK